MKPNINLRELQEQVPAGMKLIISMVGKGTPGIDDGDVSVGIRMPDHGGGARSVLVEQRTSMQHISDNEGALNNLIDKLSNEAEAMYYGR